MGNYLRVLVVDDEPELCELLTDALSDEYIHVATAANAHEAIEHTRNHSVDFIVTDLCLGDRSGLDVLDELDRIGNHIPSIVMTGRTDPKIFSEASRRHPVELMTKPLDVEHMRKTIRQEIERKANAARWQHRIRRLRRLAKDVNHERKHMRKQLADFCPELGDTYHDLSQQINEQQLMMDYQQNLLSARTDDDVFRAMFQTLTRFSGPLFGSAMVCDSQAELTTSGRFGVPKPDSLRFCELIAQPMIDKVLASPKCTQLDATDHLEEFDPAIRRYLVGITILAVPLCPTQGEMIGLVVLYRKGEQPFTSEDLELVRLLAQPTAIAIQRND
jgi:DNA-binding response OmpR family regulator